MTVLQFVGDDPAKMKQALEHAEMLLNLVNSSLVTDGKLTSRVKFKESVLDWVEDEEAAHLEEEEDEEEDDTDANP
jgi:hypothetical protein